MKAEAPKAVLAAFRRIGRRCCVYVDVEALGGGDFRGDAISVGVVVGAMRCGGGAGGLRVLPDFGEGDSAFGGAGRVLRKSATGRGRASVVDGPVDDVAAA